MRVAWCLAVALAGALAGCSLFGEDEDEPAAAAAAASEVVAENVQAVQRLEIGRTRSGLMLSAYGTARGLGFSDPRLIARRGGTPAADGLLDYDFVVDPPPEGLALPQGTVKARAVRADVEIRVDRARAVRGVRVHATEGGVQMLF